MLLDASATTCPPPRALLHAGRFWASSSLEGAVTPAGTRWVRGQRRSLHHPRTLFLRIRRSLPHRALHHPTSPVGAPRAGSAPAQSNPEPRSPWVTLGAPLRARTPKRRASASPKPLPALNPTKFPFLPLSLSPQSRSQPRRGAARRGQQSGSRLGAGKAAARRAQDLSQAELSIRPPEPSKDGLFKDKKKKQTKEKRELMDVS